MKRAVCLLGLSACGTTDWMGDPSGPGARQIASLSWVTMMAMLAISMIVYGILVYLFVRRRRGTLAEHMPYDTKGGKGWIYVWGLIIPGIVFLGSFIGGTIMMYTASPHMHAHVHKPDIVVVGHQWWWEVRYTGATPDQSFITANELHIPAGKPVLIELQSADVIHSFWIPQLHGKVDLVPGQRNHIEIEADVPGQYDGQCAEYCGGEHALMRLTVIAQKQVDYDAWRFQQHAPALMPRHDPEIRGLQVFQERACGLCHTVRGTHALGTVGPDLTHLASRKMIGANAFPNNRAYLQAWIVRPHALKPEVEMPNLSVLTGEDVNALTIYLRSLK